MTESGNLSGGVESRHAEMLPIGHGAATADFASRRPLESDSGNSAPPAQTPFLFSSFPDSKSIPSPDLEREAALTKLRAHESARFFARAQEFIVAHLHAHGETSGEDLTDACKAAGIVPHSDKAFGCVYLGLARAGTIEKAGYCARRKGHGTSGGNLWRLK